MRDIIADTNAIRNSLTNVDSNLSWAACSARGVEDQRSTLQHVQDQLTDLARKVKVLRESLR